MSSDAAREHHFVPQFYLRAFSADGRRIALYNFDRERLITNASIRHQCARRNFYKFMPMLEGALGQMEGISAEVIRTICATNTLPPLGHSARFELLTFIIFQHLRTAKAARSTDIQADYYAKLMLQGRPELNGVNLDEFEIGNKFPVALPLSHAEDVASYAADLRMHLFVNRTEREFITSDDPVVLHNQYCEGVDFRGVLGWACRGLQVVLPLSPTHLVLLFDGAVYKVGASHRGVDVTRLERAADVDQWNALQVLNAMDNVYLRADLALEPYASAFRELSPRRARARVRFVETDPLPNADGTSSALIHHYQRLLPVRLSVSTISIRREARRVELYERAGLYRDGRSKLMSDRVETMPRDSRRYAVARIIDR
jgi:hypothetical protein